MKNKKIVVTGLGTVNPLGLNVEEFWKNLVEGKSGAAPITRFDASNFKTQFACEVKGFEPEKYIDRKEIKKYDLFTQYAIAAAEEAIIDAAFELNSLSNEERARVGVIWASGYGGIGTFESQLTEFNSGDRTPRFSPFFIPKIITDIAAGIISIRYKLYGPNYCTVSACASSNTAIINALDLIRSGRADVIIVGGSEASITPASIGGFNASQALSKRNEEMETASRPFDVSRDGFVAGEGAGALILESYEYALERGAKIYAEVAGGGMAADAYHLTSTHPEGLGAVLGIKAALEDAGVDPSEIGYINAHATSTGAGDLSEMKAVAQIFKNSPDLLISSTKSMTGHMLGAAGAVESIISVLSLYQETIPATINTTEIDPLIPPELNILTGKAKKKEIVYALNNSFGFGGHTATSIFKRFSL